MTANGTYLSENVINYVTKNSFLPESGIVECLKIFYISNTYKIPVLIVNLNKETFTILLLFNVINGSIFEINAPNRK